MHIIGCSEHPWPLTLNPVLTTKMIPDPNVSWEAKLLATENHRFRVTISFSFPGYILFTSVMQALLFIRANIKGR